MNEAELAQYNVGQNLDDLMNLDPRGYGVCRILYAAARKHAKEPLTIHAAKALCRHVKKGDLVYIFTGFVLFPSRCAETDGVIGAILLARALVKTFDAKPVIICDEENMVAIRNMSRIVGLHYFDTIKEMCRYPLSMTAIAFTKDAKKAAGQAEEIMASGLPSIVITNESAGANRQGVYHNAAGIDVTELEAKSDILFVKLQEKGVPSISIGDLGNEIGMGTLGDHLDRFIPYAAEGACSCECEGGLAVDTSADIVVTATVSNWGCNGMMAALAFLKKDLDIFQSAEMEREVVITASRSGMVNMDGWLVPAVDGFGLKLDALIVDLMRETVKYALKYEHFVPGKRWFDKVLELKYFDLHVAKEESV